MMTFLDLVNAYITEYGINGGQLLASTGGGTISPGLNTPGTGSSTHSPEVAKIVAAIADADYEIQSLHHDWKFLWRQYRGTFSVGQDWLATPQRPNANATGYVGTLYTLRRVDRESLSINYTSQTQAFRPRFMEWRHFESLWQSRGAKQSSDYPTNWTLTPAGNPLVSSASATGLPYQYECWVRPQRLNADGDISPLVLAVAHGQLGATGSPYAQPPYALATPSTTGTLEGRAPINTNQTPTAAKRLESCRIIIVRAAIIMAAPEGATDMMQAALAEYDDLLEALRADQLPGMENDRMSEVDIPLVVETY